MLMMLVVFNLMPPVFTLVDYFNLLQVQRETLLQMELAGGMTPAIHQEALDKLAEYGFDMNNIQISATPAPVDYGGDVELSMSYNYTYDKYSFSGFLITKTDELRTMSTSGKSVSFYFEK